MELSFTQGRWKYDHWGGFDPISSSTAKPPRVELLAVFDVPRDQVGASWKGLTHALSGLFCASVNFLESSTMFFAPEWSFRQASGQLRYGLLPREAVCIQAGGSSGIVFAWDLRWQQQSILLSGFGSSDTIARPLSESEVWEVQYDYYTKPSDSNTSSSRILPAMICSEDGILAVIEQGEEPTELLAEPCAINSFVIDRQNPSDVICSLEWESVVILSRS